jgi:hypothetical protein
MSVRRIKLNELANIIKAVIKEVELSDDVKMMLSNWNRNPDRDIDKILERLELVSDKIGGIGVEFLRPTEKYSKGFFRQPIAIYVKLPKNKEDTVLYDLSKNEYKVISYQDFYLNWLEKKEMK